MANYKPLTSGAITYQNHTKAL